MSSFFRYFMTSASDRHSRWAPCDVLRANHISYIHWYEDALRHYGSKTIVFFLYLIVDSVNDAETCLRSAGWTPATLPKYSPQYYDPAIDEQTVLVFGDDPEAVVILLSADPWPGVGVSSSESAGDCAPCPYPTLSKLYNALAQRSLDTDCDAFRCYLNLQLAYLYLHCAELASPDFVLTLPEDIRQYHLDWASETLCIQAPQTIQHEREVRERARRGDWVLMYQGSAEVGGLKIDREYEAALLARVSAKAGVTQTERT
ncbi:hypothetical protein GSI_06884 [Ganoderma sinense ZZ0214-1]|uniref:Uncharacterized protein n=1 Tax=Ganoderma sinense ZZ0214-1 TaxID=1077348 RepID=A0A2G8SAD1_9APHY|nr:hypothetical protein GSI_06884 [Ganoderma sinense ZZ0214-1]